MIGFHERPSGADGRRRVWDDTQRAHISQPLLELTSSGELCQVQVALADLEGAVRKRLGVRERSCHHPSSFLRAPLGSLGRCLVTLEQGKTPAQEAGQSRPVVVISNGGTVEELAVVAPSAHYGTTVLHTQYLSLRHRMGHLVHLPRT